eukprot:scaffold773_cov114-Isochrysis_galbana.AAC.15
MPAATASVGLVLLAALGGSAITLPPHAVRCTGPTVHRAAHVVAMAGDAAAKKQALAEFNAQRQAKRDAAAAARKPKSSGAAAPAKSSGKSGGLALGGIFGAKPAPPPAPKPAAAPPPKPAAPLFNFGAKTASAQAKVLPKAKAPSEPKASSKPAASLFSFGAKATVPQPAPAPAPKPPKPATPLFGFETVPEWPSDDLPSFEGDVAFDGDVISPPAPPRVSTDTASQIGIGVTGALGGAVLADALITATGVSMSGELLADAAAVGAVMLGGGALYAATQPGQAGEAVRFVGGSVANVTAAYAELAALEAEIALLEQQQKARAKIEATVSEITATPGRIVNEVRGRGRVGRVGRI